MKRIEKFGEQDLAVTNGWITIEAFCEHCPIPEDKIRHYRRSGKWLDGIVTKVFDKQIWVNVWEVNLWFINNF